MIIKNYNHLKVYKNKMKKMNNKIKVNKMQNN
jgi:hypothetical protein